MADIWHGIRGGLLGLAGGLTVFGFAFGFPETEEPPVIRIAIEAPQTRDAALP